MSGIDAVVPVVTVAIESVPIVNTQYAIHFRERDDAVIGLATSGL